MFFKFWNSVNNSGEGNFSAGGDLNNSGTINSNNTTKNSHKTTINNIIHGIGGHAAASLGGAFYAYIHDIRNETHWRMVIIFASRAVADDWWREVSTSAHPLLKNNIKRITPQFYTHDTQIWNVYHFFVEPRISDIADKFRGKMFLVLENDRPGRGITIIPTQTIVDHASGQWFAIRSKANADHHWYYDSNPSSGTHGCIIVSPTHRSSFKITSPSRPEGAIITRNDDITIVAQHFGFVRIQAYNGPGSAPGTTALGVTAEPSEATQFQFEDLEKGKFVLGLDEPPSPLCYLRGGGANPGWELAV